MQPKIFKIAFFVVVFFTGLVWCGCTKDENASSASQTDKGSIYGTVTDYATGEPVANANVSLRPGGETTLTGIDGRFEFLDLADGGYSLTVSKAEYSDLIDDYVIQVRSGKSMRRDVQIKKQPTYLRFIDSNGNPISCIDFGNDVSVVSKKFKIFNSGAVPISCQTIYNCNWLSSVTSIPNEIVSGQTVSVTININRSRLVAGINETRLTIRSNNGSNEILIKASSTNGNPPLVGIQQASGITATSATLHGVVQNSNGASITDRGFCWSATQSTPTSADQIVSLGAGNDAFSFQINNLDQNTIYYVRAFARSSLGTGYSQTMTFTTLFGLPVCGNTVITNLDPSIVRAISSAQSSNGYSITDKGVCWSSAHTPTINDNRISAGSGDGSISVRLYPLQTNTTYRARSYATNGFGTVYGQEVTFTTLSGLATVSTTTATLSNNYVLTGGNVTDSGGASVIVKGVCYGNLSNPTISSSRTYDGEWVGPFSSMIPIPSNSGYLYIRAYATTQYGTSYGNQVRVYVP